MSRNPSHRKTCERWNEPGHAHSITFSCFQRRPFLSKDRSRQWTVDALDKARKKHNVHLWAYVLMPEHLHLLVWPTNPVYSISDFLKSLKLSVTARALAFVRQHSPGFLASMEDRQPDGTVSYRFWQRGGGYDRNLMEPRTWNPGPSGRRWNTSTPTPSVAVCAVNAADWPWSSAAEWERPGSGHS